uniref:Sodium/nucleoside cotransporter n=1 Tax=Glossina austeni TaxID=7395 RepID=A0A1A9VTA3_GLOAU
MNELSSNGELNEAFTRDEEMESGITDITGTRKTEDDQTVTEQNAKHRKRSEAGLKQFTITCLKRSVHLVVVGYFAYATYHYLDVEANYCNDSKNDNHIVNEDGSGNQTNHLLCGIQYCDGYGFLALLLGFTYLGLFYYLVFKPKIGHRLYRSILKPLRTKYLHFSKQRSISLLQLLLLALALIIFLYFETRNAPSKLVGLLAPCVFISGGYVFSSQRQAIKWRQITIGIAAQFLLCIVCIRWTVGRNIFNCIGNKVATFLAYADAGNRFVFGDTIVIEGVFAFTALPVIFFFSFIISVLYYLNAMQIVIMKLGWILQKLLDTTVCESVNAAANIFLGMSECPLVIRPYIAQLTASEIHSIMVSGFATVSGTVLAAYLKFGASAAHLITASVMAAPASLALSKLYMPETEESKTKSDNIKLAKSKKIVRKLSKITSTPKQYGYQSSFEDIQSDCDSIIHNLKQKLRPEFQMGRSAQMLTEIGELLLQLDERATDMATETLNCAFKRLHDQIVMLQDQTERDMIECKYYYTSVLFDITMEQNQKLLREVYEYRKNLQEGLTLLKVWVCLRQLDKILCKCFTNFFQFLKAVNKLQRFDSVKIEDTSVLDAAANGANNALPIVLGIVANLVAFLGFITFLNAMVSWLGFLVGVDQIDFEWVFSKLFIPLAWIMGVPWKDCDIVAKVVATKTIINEFVAYERLGEYIKNEAIDVSIILEIFNARSTKKNESKTKQARSAGIATFAICGFANPSSMGILIGSLSAMAPKQRPLIAKVAVRALVVGSIVCFMSASFAGIFIDEEQAL